MRFDTPVDFRLSFHRKVFRPRRLRLPYKRTAALLFFHPNHTSLQTWLPQRFTTLRRSRARTPRQVRRQVGWFWLLARLQRQSRRHLAIQNTILTDMQAVKVLEELLGKLTISKAQDEINASAASIATFINGDIEEADAPTKYVVESMPQTQE